MVSITEQPKVLIGSILLHDTCSVFQTELHRLDSLFRILWVLTTHRVVPRTAVLQSEYGNLLLINTRIYPRLTQ